MQKLHSNPTHAAAGPIREGGWKQEAFAKELATLRSRLGVDVKGLAQKLGMSPAKVSRWLSESSDVCRQPTASDGIEIGLLEAATHGTNPFKACRRWLLLCGREMSDDEFNARLAEAESLEKHIEDAYDKLSRLLRRKTLEPAEARVALSAYFAQRECEDRIHQWLKRSNGIGNACFFWQWDNGKVVDRLTGKLLSATKGLFTLVCSPPNNLTESWDEPVQQEPQLGVCGFILDPGQDARSRLMEIEPVYRELLTSGKLRLFIEITQEKTGSFEHPADAWIFLGNGSNRFGVFASEGWQGFQKLVDSGDQELAKNPWRWASQLAPIKTQGIIPFLRRRKIMVQEAGIVQVDGTAWEQVTFSN